MWIWENLPKRQHTELNMWKVWKRIMWHEEWERNEKAPLLQGAFKASRRNEEKEIFRRGNGWEFSRSGEYHKSSGVGLMLRSQTGLTTWICTSVDYSQIVYQRGRDDAKCNQGKIHVSPQFSPSGEKKSGQPASGSDAVTVQEWGGTDTALREFTKGTSYRHISGKRIVVSEGGFQMQNRVDKK